MLEDLGNLGDFLGGIAVIATLVYIAIQIRQNTTQIAENSERMRLSFENDIRRELNNFRLSIATDEGLSSIWRRGLDDEQLDEVDRGRFELLILNLIAMLTEQFHAHQLDLYDIDRRIPYFAAVVRNPGFRSYWDWISERGVVREDVQRYIDSLARSEPPAGNSEP